MLIWCVFINESPKLQVLKDFWVSVVIMKLQCTMKIKGVGWWKVLSYTLVQNVTEVFNLVKPVLLWMEALQSWTIQLTSGQKCFLRA